MNSKLSSNLVEISLQQQCFDPIKSVRRFDVVRSEVFDCRLPREAFVVVILGVRFEIVENSALSRTYRRPRVVG